MVTVFSIIANMACNYEIHLASALPVGDLSVRMRNDRHEPNGAEKQRPERIPVNPEHRSYSRNATGAVAVDPLLQNGRRLEHYFATRGNRHLGACLRVTADTLIFLEIVCHCSVSLPFQKPQSPGNVSQHRNASLVHASA